MQANCKSCIWSQVRRLRSTGDYEKDFSVGLRLIRDDDDDLALARCNGWHSEHRNRLERGTNNYIIPENTFHVHVQTERYLAFGRPKKIGFATAITAYDNLAQAVEYFVDRFGFISKSTGKPFNLYPLIPW